MNMRIIIVGCSGFLGRELRAYLQEQGHTVKPLSIREHTDIKSIAAFIEGWDVVINLAGLSIFGRWSESYKKALYNSRINTTHKLVEAMKICQKRPEQFISTSAVGIYPNDIACDEDSKEFSSGYLAQICKDWENTAQEAQELGVMTSIFRLGVILGKNGGMIKKVWLPFSLGLGGRVGDGKQSLSWIHINDLCRAYLHVLEGKSGIYNLCSPEVTINSEFTKTLGSLMHRPTVIPVPEFFLRLIFREGADFMLEGKIVYPKSLLESGFEFNYKTIQDALKSFF